MELAILLSLGVLAALATSLVSSGMRIPGHAILRGTLPLVLGISLVPRRTAGSVMSLTAGATFALFRLVGWGLPNPAACIGLVCLGPAVDLALNRATNGWMLYARFAAAGLVANLIAFAVRMASGPAGLGGGPGRGAAVHAFWPTAALSFALCGALAGLLCGMIWFRARPHSEGPVSS